MRRSVFFAVWLGLVLSLLKEGTPVGTPSNTEALPSSTPAEGVTDDVTATDAREVTTSEPTEAPTGTPSNTAAVPSSTPAGNGTENGTNPDPPHITTSKDSRDELTGNDTGNETGPDPPEVTTSEPTEGVTDDVTATDPPEVTTSEPTEISTVNGTATRPTDMPPSVPPADFCHGDPCGNSSATCISLQRNYTCVCQYGFYYNNNGCYKGEVYPATIEVRASYSDNLQNVNSTEYQYLFDNVSAFFKKAFENLTDYKETVIVKIQPSNESRSSGSLKVTVTNLFTWNSAVNADTVRSAVQRAIQNNNQSFVSSYEVAKHCGIYPCDPKTTVCVEGEQFPDCKCKLDLEKKEGDIYSCSDSKLILIIVGTVFGAIILSLVIAISVISVRAKNKQNPEKRSLMKSGYSDMNTSDDRPSMFPRVQTTSGHANPGYQPNNPYEMRSTNRDHFSERDYDDLKDGQPAQHWVRAKSFTTSHQCSYFSRRDNNVLNRRFSQDFLEDSCLKEIMKEIMDNFEIRGKFLLEDGPGTMCDAEKHQYPELHLDLCSLNLNYSFGQMKAVFHKNPACFTLLY
ncbi:hypothetical protein DV515_00005643 [Chloebia gouldiae]|uniref:SEA domain-containing protein n=1 Tax=Chloebia gouldiae TaxID=44316 RepID=A0A3L8SN61_CHLGU|nr:hypothetical protein DV515_00005643 [Chloebia gouldiae]